MIATRTKARDMILVDFRNCDDQIQDAYCNKTPCIWRAQILYINEKSNMHPYRCAFELSENHNFQSKFHNNMWAVKPKTLKTMATTSET